MKAIILAGGKGTRLSSVIKDVPKPMAPINGVPFLTILLKELISSGIGEVVLSVGYKAEKIIKAYGDCPQIRFSIEESPLLTGGAIKKALTNFSSDDNVFIVNGDSFLSLNFVEMHSFHLEKNADITIACPLLKHYDRYGTVGVDSNSRIIRFEEKQYHDIGLINGGVYCVRAGIVEEFVDDVFSFENWLEQNCLSYRMFSYQAGTNFIDIGVPEDYMRAQQLF